MSDFKGTFKHAVDQKGRFSVPIQVVSGLALSADHTFVVSTGPEKCLDAYPKDEWTRRVQKLKSLPGGKLGRYYKRLIVGDARECKLDGHKRILVPPEILARVGITNMVLIVGQIDHLELWKPEDYETYLESQDIAPADVFDKMDSYFNEHQSGANESDRVR